MITSSSSACCTTRRLLPARQRDGVSARCSVTPASRTVRSGRRTVRPGNAQIFIWIDVGPACHSSSSSSLRPEPSGARALARLAPPSVDLPPPATKPRFLVREPSPAPPPPSQTPIPASPQPESPNHLRSPLEVLEALLHRRSASPVVLRSNRPREWIRGEFLVLPGLFPLPWCVAGAGERPSPSPPHLLPPVARVKSYASRTVHYRRADGPPLKLEICPETMLSLVGFAGLSCGRSAAA